MNQATTEVLICGAGAAGLALAIELARRNIGFRLIEKRTEPFHGSRGKGLQPRTLEIFDDMGIVDRVFARGGDYPATRRYTAAGHMDGSAMEVVADTASAPYPSPRMLPQFLTEAAMRERLAELGHRPQFACELVGFEQDAEYVTARLAGPQGSEHVRARYLVGADGGRSFVRHALEIGFEGESLGTHALVADLVLEGLSREHWHMWGETPMQSLMLCPLQGTGLFQLQAPIGEDAPDMSAQGLARFIQVRTGRSDIVVSGVAWSSAYAMSARLADRYRVGRVFIAGDAAHIHPPTGGQGLNTSIQDAYNLGWKIAAVLRGTPPSLLDTYEAERRPVAAEMLQLARDLLAAYKNKADVRRGRNTQQLDIAYPGSPLTLRLALPATGLRPGDRAPDAHCLGAGSTPLRLFDCFRGTHWTLLSLGDTQVPVRPGLRIYSVGPKRELLDHAGEIVAHYGMSEGGHVLIRPDGYISAIVGASEGSLIDRHLDAIGMPACDECVISVPRIFQIQQPDPE